jgi:hypothetical protein
MIVWNSVHFGDSSSSRGYAGAFIRQVHELHAQGQSKIVQDAAWQPAVESRLAEHVDARVGTRDSKTTEKILMYP